MGDSCETSELDSEMIVEFKSQSPYRKNQNCKLTFICPEETHVIVDVKEFALEDYSYAKAKCVDFLSIDGNRQCGSSIPIFRTTKREIEAIFQSNRRRNLKGFNIQLGCTGLLLLHILVWLLFLIKCFFEILFLKF